MQRQREQEPQNLVSDSSVGDERMEGQVQGLIANMLLSYSQMPYLQ